MNNLALVGAFPRERRRCWCGRRSSKLVGASAGEVGTLDATRLMNQSGSLVLDVRDEKDFAAGHLPRARHIPVRSLQARMGEIAKFKDKPVIVTDRARRPRRRRRAPAEEIGLHQRVQLKGGLAAWQQASLPGGEVARWRRS